MFDGIKIVSLSSSPSDFMRNPLLEFSGRHSLRNGHDMTGRRSCAFHQGLRFTAFRTNGGWHRMELDGSLHCYYNNGRHNYNDFTGSNLAFCIEELRCCLGLIPETEILNNVEFGINIIIDFPVQILLDSVMSYKGIPFRSPAENHTYLQCETEEFIIKIYDKGTQFKLTNHVLRFEIKVRKMKFLRNKGVEITTLADLLCSQNYPKMGEILVGYFNQILFRDPHLDMTRLTSLDRELYLQGGLKNFWQRPNLVEYPNSRLYEAARKRQKRAENRYRSLFAPRYIPDLSNQINAKWLALSNNVRQGD